MGERTAKPTPSVGLGGEIKKSRHVVGPKGSAEFPGGQSKKGNMTKEKREAFCDIIYQRVLTSRPGGEGGLRTMPPTFLLGAPAVGVCIVVGKGPGMSLEQGGQWWRVGVGYTSEADGARAPDSSEPGRTWSRLGDKGL